MSATAVKSCAILTLREMREAGEFQCSDDAIVRCAEDLCDKLVDQMAGQTFKVPLRTFRERREMEGLIQDMFGGGNSRRKISRSLRIHRRRVVPKAG
jgi:hypothetical protein